jgi:putative nucleotidyltransferase with HDIG domain
MNEKLDRYIKGVKHLPATPTVLVQLTELCQLPDHGVDEVFELIRKDPALTGEVLRHSNSARFAHDKPIADIFEAITRVGYYEIYRAAVSKLCSQLLQVPDGVCSMEVEKLWHHSAMAAVSAAAVARKVHENEDLAFTAGLLHDIGKVVLASAEGNAYTALTDGIGDKGDRLHSAEARQFGFSHADIGGRLITQWGLPQDIAAPILHHHELDWAEPFERICAVVSLGNIMAHAANDGSPGGEYNPQTAVRAMDILHLHETDMPMLMLNAKIELECMGGLPGGQFSCKRPRGLPRCRSCRFRLAHESN